MKGSNEIRSHVLNMPNDHKRKYTNYDRIKKNESKPCLSKGSTLATPILDSIVTDVLESTERSLINLSPRFLPYIYAQNGIEKVKHMIKSEKFNQSTFSLPILRKNSSVNILADSRLMSQNLSLFRMKSVELPNND